MRGRTVLLIGVIAVLALALPQILPGRGGTAGEAPTAVVTSYTCCSARDIDTVRHPGETFEIHWTPVRQVVAIAQQPTTITLSATLSGAFDSVRGLKSAVASGGDGSQQRAAVTVTAAPVVVTSDGSATPVSTITVPPTAAPGYYNLTTSWASGGTSTSGGSVIQVAAG